MELRTLTDTEYAEFTEELEEFVTTTRYRQPAFGDEIGIFCYDGYLTEPIPEAVETPFTSYVDGVYSDVVANVGSGTFYYDTSRKVFIVREGVMKAYIDTMKFENNETFDYLKFEPELATNSIEHPLGATLPLGWYEALMRAFADSKSLETQAFWNKILSNREKRSS